MTQLALCRRHKGSKVLEAEVKAKSQEAGGRTISDTALLGREDGGKANGTTSYYNFSRNLMIVTC